MVDFGFMGAIIKNLKSGIIKVKKSAVSL